MSWTGQSFRQKHNRELPIEHADRAAKIANAVLRESGDEGKAIRVANAVIRHHAEKDIQSAVDGRYRSSRK